MQATLSACHSHRKSSTLSLLLCRRTSVCSPITSSQENLVTSTKALLRCCIRPFTTRKSPTSSCGCQKARLQCVRCRQVARAVGMDARDRMQHLGRRALKVSVERVPATYVFTRLLSERRLNRSLRTLPYHMVPKHQNATSPSLWFL